MGSPKLEGEVGELTGDAPESIADAARVKAAAPPAAVAATSLHAEEEEVVAAKGAAEAVGLIRSHCCCSFASQTRTASCRAGESEATGSQESNAAPNWGRCSHAYGVVAVVVEVVEVDAAEMVARGVGWEASSLLSAGSSSV